MAYQLNSTFETGTNRITRDDAFPALESQTIVFAGLLKLKRREELGRELPISYSSQKQLRESLPPTLAVHTDATVQLHALLAEKRRIEARIEEIVSNLPPEVTEPDLFCLSPFRSPALPPGADKADAVCSLNVAEMLPSQLQQWADSLLALGIVPIMRSFLTGRRYLRYIIDLAYQYHMCTVFLYMFFFDPSILRDDMRKTVVAEDPKRFEDIRRARNALAHGDAMRTYLNKDDFEFMAAALVKHKDALMDALSTRVTC